MLEVVPEPAVVWAVAPLGYPLRRDLASGKEFQLDLERMREKGCKVYFGSIAYEGGKLISKGSRALELVSIGDFEESSRRLESCVKLLNS